MLMYVNVFSGADADWTSFFSLWQQVLKRSGNKLFTTVNVATLTSPWVN